MARVRQIESDSDFTAALMAAGDSLVLVDFFATWCGPCQMIAPVIEGLAARYTNVVFLKVDVDRSPRLRQAMGITAMPTFIYFRNCSRVHQVTGANAQEIERGIEDCLAGRTAAGVAAAAAAAAEEESGVPGQQLLTGHIAKDKVEGENIKHAATVASVFLAQAGGGVESDCDEQLLLGVGFDQSVKLHSMRITAPNDGRAPAIVKLFANRATLPDFDTAVSATPTQALELTRDQATGASIIPLRFVNFQNVQHLTIFVQTNQGGEDTTAVTKIELIGGLRETADMGSFKRVSGRPGESDH